MGIKLDFNECLKDSPQFRHNLTLAENDVDHYENTYKKVKIIFKKMVLKNF